MSCKFNLPNFPFQSEKERLVILQFVSMKLLQRSLVIFFVILIVIKVIYRSHWKVCVWLIRQEKIFCTSKWWAPYFIISNSAFAVFESELIVVGQWKNEGFFWFINFVLSFVNFFPCQGSKTTYFLSHFCFAQNQSIWNAIALLVKSLYEEIVLWCSKKKIYWFYGFVLKEVFDPVLFFSCSNHFGVFGQLINRCFR